MIFFQRTRTENLCISPGSLFDVSSMVESMVNQQYCGTVMLHLVHVQAEIKSPEQEFDLPYDIGPDVDFDVHPQILLPGTLLT